MTAFLVALLVMGGVLGQRPQTAEASNRWIDVNLSTLTIRAMVGNTPVYTAYITSGRRGFETPTGTFYIQRRVYNETMDSRTLGVPLNAPGGYYLENVYFTQYFTSWGHALHFNWWSPASTFGNRNVTRGCVSMNWHASQYFWNFATVGTPVVIHY